MIWREANQMLNMAEQTETADAPLAELTDLCAQLDRGVQTA